MTATGIRMRKVGVGLAVLWLLSAAAPARAEPRLRVERLTWRSFMFSIEDASAAAAPLAVLWRWSDGVISGDRRAVHRFPGPGVYSAAVEITETDGRTSRLEQSVIISFFSSGNWMAWAIAVLCAFVSGICILAARHFRREMAATPPGLDDRQGVW